MKAKAAVQHSNYHLVLAFIVMAIAFLFSLGVNAAPLKTTASKKTVKATQSVLAAKVAPKTEEKKTWVAAASLSVETSSGINSAEKKTYSGEYMLVPSLTHNPTKTSAAAKIVYGREYSQQKDDNTDGDLSSIAIALRKSVEVNGVIDGFHFGPNFTIPAGNEARRQTLNGAIGATVGATKKLGKFSLKQDFSYSYRFYRYDIRDNGVVNSPHAFSSASSGSYQLNDWFGLSGEFAVQQLINFQGTPTAFSSAAAGADFTVTKNAGISMGLATVLAGTLSDDGQRNRFVLYDPGVTIAYLTLVLSL